MAAIFLYVTCADAGQAGAIGRALVEARLAACANILPGVTAIYRWQGRIAAETETVLVAKTRADLVAAATARIKALHSYTLPCIVALPISGGNAEFLAWIEAETAGPSDTTENRA